MAKIKKIFKCSNCGEEYSKWQGNCKECKEWSTIDEVEASSIKSVNKEEVLSHSGYAGLSGLATIKKLSSVKTTDLNRTTSGIAELDRVLGGGITDDSVILLGGDPGIGKSTLLIQVISNIVSSNGKKALYVTGEESPSQVKNRAIRLGLDIESIYILPETNIENIISLLEEFKPDFLIIDSIQVMFSSTVTSSPGSKKQLEDVTKIISRYSKSNNLSTFIIGHVTKDGTIAGPKVLEHIVDTVLYFEGEEDSKFRMIRATKNRFGEVNEVGVFVMGETGLKEVSNPSAIFLNKYEKPIAGSAIFVTREGTRNLMVEVQSLVTETTSDYTERKAVGLDRDRLSMIVAILQKKMSLKLWQQSIFVSVVGGVKLKETASDLAVVLAILSSMNEKPLPNDLVTFGELGLAGEIRPISSGEERMREAIKQGITKFIIPKGNYPRGKRILEEMKGKNIKIYSVSDIYEFYDAFAQIV